ncbi:hypothetical protein HDZ31DRAFT_61542 [Schizophyllum fasciatum]
MHIAGPAIALALGVARAVSATSAQVSQGCGNTCVARLHCASAAGGPDVRACRCRAAAVPRVLECLLAACASDEERFEADAAFGAYCGGF